MFFLVNSDVEAARTLMLKMAKQARPGALIPCTEDEIDSFVSRDFVPVCLSMDQEKLVEVDASKKYILFANPGDTNIDDVLRASSNLDVNISIVRMCR